MTLLKTVLLLFAHNVLLNQSMIAQSQLVIFCNVLGADCFGSIFGGVEYAALSLVNLGIVVSFPVLPRHVPQ